MNGADFDEVFREVRGRYAYMENYEDVKVFDFIRASEVEIEEVERELRVQLPAEYKSFMQFYGGGQFLFMDLLPVASPDNRMGDLLKENEPDSAFIRVAPVGTGDWWGFEVISGACSRAVSTLDHDFGDITADSEDFLVFVSRRGLRWNLK